MGYVDACIGIDPDGECNNNVSDNVFYDLDLQSVWIENGNWIPDE